MKVTNKIDIHLDDLRHIPPINVMQADAYTRVLEFSLYSGGQAWNVPEGVDVAVAYIGSSGKGIYDTLPDGAAACDVNGNVVTAVVAPQAVAMDGNTNLNIIFTDGEGHQLAAFCVTLKVERNPAVNATKPPDYINLRQWMTAELANLVWDYAINVYPDQAGDGYVSERPYDAILREYESGRAVYCALEISDQERLQLPFVKIDGGVLYFSAVCAGKEYLVTISADGVTVEQSEVGSGGGSGNPGEDGGYYTPTVIDNGDGTMTVSFAASNADMPAVDPVTVVLPEGQKGYSPTANVEQTDSGAIIHIYDKNGHTFATVENGKNGGDGKDGNGIKSAVLNDDYTLTLTFDDGNSYTTPSIRGATGADGKDYSFDPTAYGLPVLYLTGDISPIKVSKDNKVTLDYVYGEQSGTCTLKGQGSSSYATAQGLGDKGKYNYTINFDTAFEAVDGWGAQTKYCLKANFIDHSHARNVVCAKLWGQIVKSRSSVPAELATLPNGGAIDGFPIIIMLNGEFHGLYTWNIPKDRWMFNMGSGTKEAIVGADNQAEDTAFKTETLLNADGLELEYAADTFTAEQVKASLNRLISACINTTGSDLDTTVAQYLEWESAIDYFLFVVFIDGGDMTTKNYLLVTFDGIKWIFSAYDMDSVMGLRWDGKYLFGAHEGTKFASYRDLHRAMELVYRFKTDALKARWKELRGYYLTESRVSRLFENFVAAIPSPVYLEDVKKWTAIPCSSVNNVNQILRWVRQRLEYVDAWVDALPEQEVPEQPAEMVNVVPSSIDTDGTIYNGVGYKDDTRLSSNGSVSGTAQSDTVTIGFVPFSRSTGIIRMKGATFPSISGKHFYIHLYDANKTHVCGLPASAWANDGNTNYPGMNISYDEATGITTFDFTACTGNSEWATKVASASYFRLCANGKGADLIVTVNEEIT